MYQFYYSDKSTPHPKQNFKDDVRNHFNITAVRPTMWEEHCLECSAPLCFESCMHYAARSDGRCKRFENGLLTFEEEKACCGQGAHLKFRQWGNMMTIIYPAMLSIEEYNKLFLKNEKMGKRLKKIESSSLPQSLRWQGIRIPEFLRRRKLRGLNPNNNTAHAFVFHGYSYTSKDYRLILEVYNDHTSVFKISLEIKPGENLSIINNLSEECSVNGNLVKIYPENNLDAELDILWCDFVQGSPVINDSPADKVKCVVWDLDGTLWDGTLIETDDPTKLTLKSGILATIKELDNRGIIQSIASKNDHNQAMPVIEGLGISDYFIYPQINWGPKSDSLEVIAKNLNIGIDSLAFVDDSIFERKQVSDVWSQVRVYDASEIEDLLNKEEFNVPVTAESRNRRIMYKAEEKRNILKASQNTDIVEFLRKCNLNLNVFEPKTDEEILRCYELVVRTNQLNMTGIKYSRDDFDLVLRRDNHKNFAFSCSDDFGEYGIVGFGQYKIENEAIVFTEFAMSCRVAGKFIESALFTNLLKNENCNIGYFSVQKTKKNILLRNTLEKIGFTQKSNTDDSIDYSFDSNLLNFDIVSVDI